MLITDHRLKFILVTILFLASGSFAQSESVEKQSDHLRYGLLIGPAYAFSSGPGYGSAKASFGFGAGMLAPINKDLELRISAIRSNIEFDPDGQIASTRLSPEILDVDKSAWALSLGVSLQAKTKVKGLFNKPARLFAYAGFGEIIHHLSIDRRLADTEDGREIWEESSSTNTTFTTIVGIGFSQSISSRLAIEPGVQLEVFDFGNNFGLSRLVTIQTNLRWR